ncbi:MAG: ABC transporter permease, partial [Planctomycetota bacterium]
MRWYVARRLLVLVVVLLGASIFTFLLVSLSPGDPAEIILSERMGGERPTPEALAQFRRGLGLDRPAHERYLLWAGRCLSGDFGVSFRTGESIAGELGRRLANTLPLAILAILVSLFLAAPVGTKCARSSGRLFDRVCLALTFLLLSTPVFLTGIVLVLFFAVSFHVLP